VIVQHSKVQQSVRIVLVGEHYSVQVRAHTYCFLDVDQVTCAIRPSSDQVNQIR
jgi:hypothetical protein